MFEIKFTISSNMKQPKAFIKYSSLFLIFLIEVCPSVMAQSWDSIYHFNIQDATWDHARVDVSANNHILCSFRTIRSGRSLDLSVDGGQSFQTVLNDFQRGFAGFDDNNNIYLVSEKKNSGVSTNYFDSVYFSNDNGQNFMALAEHPNGGYDYSTFYIDDDNYFYCLDKSLGANLEPLYALYLNGQFSSNIPSHVTAGSNALRGLTKLSNGTLVVSTYNDGVHYSSDNGQSWTASQNDQVLGTATFTSFAQANNGDLFLAGPSLKVSSDDGETWANSNLTTNWIDKVEKAGSGKLIARGAFSSPPLFESDDDGQTWIQLANQPNGNCQDFETSNDYLYAIFDNVLYRYPISGSSVSLEENLLDIEIYPNPCGSSDIKINIPTSSACLEVRSVNGELIYRRRIDEQLILKREVFPRKGLYLLNLRFENGYSQLRKLIIN